MRNVKSVKAFELQLKELEATLRKCRLQFLMITPFFKEDYEKFNTVVSEFDLNFAFVREKLKFLADYYEKL